jgi:hypothetical protein
MLKEVIKKIKKTVTLSSSTRECSLILGTSVVTSLIPILLSIPKVIPAGKLVFLPP